MGKMRLKLTIDDWTLIDDKSNGIPLTEFIRKELIRILLHYDLKKISPTIPLQIIKTVELDPTTDEKLIFISNKLGISPPEFTRRFILNPLVGKDKMPISLEDIFTGD